MKKQENKSKLRKFIGKIVSLNLEKCVKVEVVSYKKHPKYKKFMRQKTNFLVRCDNSKDLVLGDKVSFRESRPLSRKIRYIFIDKV